MYMYMYVCYCGNSGATQRDVDGARQGRCWLIHLAVHISWAGSAAAGALHIAGGAGHLWLALISPPLRPPSCSPCITCPVHAGLSACFH